MVILIIIIFIISISNFIILLNNFGLVAIEAVLYSLPLNLTIGTGITLLYLLLEEIKILNSKK